MTAKIGHNQPPEPLDPLPAIIARVDALNAEAKAWLTGASVTCQKQADGLQSIANEALKLEQDADNERKVEKLPHDNAAKAVQERWKIPIATAGTVKETARKALLAWKLKQEAERKAIADEKQRIADIATREAQEAAQAARADNDLSAIQDADILLEQARIAGAVAKKASQPVASGLRTSRVAVVTDRHALQLWIKAKRPAHHAQFLADVEALLTKYANEHKDVPMDGVTVEERKVSI